MTASEDIALVRAFVAEVQVEGRLDLVDHYIHPDFRNGTAEGTLAADRSGVAQNMAALCAAFADRSVEIVHCSAADGVVASHKILRGRHVGPWLGAAPTGERVRMRHMDFLRVEDGRIVEHWSCLRPLEPDS